MDIDAKQRTAASGLGMARWRIAATGAAVAIAAALPLVLVDEPQLARAAAVALACLALWLSEAVPPYVPTLLLVVLVPLVLGPSGAQFRLPSVLAWLAEPVLALFFGGFALGLAARRHGLDAVVARAVIRAARGRRALLLLFVMAGTAGLSMWMSNIAAAAMMIAALRPMTASEVEDGSRRSLLLAVALGANLGGMATPVGTGPNAIAIAALAPSAGVTFVGWMAFALPLTALMLAFGFALLVARFRAFGRFDEGVLDFEVPARGASRPSAVAFVFAACILLWLSEPLHHVPASVTALGAAAFLFGSSLLRPDDLGRLDWSTLFVIGGGIVLGRLLEVSGIVDALAAAIDWHALAPVVRRLAVVFASALLSALMSNTATATMLVPLASSLDPSAATPVLVAIGCSLGFPFIISTPPNAMVYGQGARSSDLVAIGLPSMLFGCVLVSLTGDAVLAWFGLG